ncbi:GTP-binding protein [uncultured Algibacter sp.]|uniref:GTP-binding protein n=1 Tax=uncultured Algibacter sp. TaxID=298659 RepID=UPI003217F655
MPLSNDIVLRPRFKIKILDNQESLIDDFKHAKKNQSEFNIVNVGKHIFIRFPRQKKYYWSPQLHLQIHKINKTSSEIRGQFGPTPQVWTIFMILHFIVATLFIVFGLWTYNNWVDKQSFTLQASITILMVLTWVTLYFVGSIGKATNTSNMRMLNTFMKNVLRIEQNKAL